jgi:hypothetical protein
VKIRPLLFFSLGNNISGVLKVPSQNSCGKGQSLISCSPKCVEYCKFKRTDTVEFHFRYCQQNLPKASFSLKLNKYRHIICRDCGFDSRWRHGCLSLVSVVCCQVDVTVSCWSLVQRNHTECGVSECDRKASIMRRPWPTGAVAPW